MTDDVIAVTAAMALSAEPETLTRAQLLDLLASLARLRELVDAAEARASSALAERHARRTRSAQGPLSCRAGP